MTTYGIYDNINKTLDIFLKYTKLLKKKRTMLSGCIQYDCRQKFSLFMKPGAPPAGAE